MPMRPLLVLTTVTAVAAGVWLAPPASSEDRPDVSSAVFSDTSEPLRELDATPSPSDGRQDVVPQKPTPGERIDDILSGEQSPPSIPHPTGPAPGQQMPGLLSDFEGLSNSDGVLPPDTVGDVGPNHYVQMVNLSLQIFDKDGTGVYGPVPSNTIWTGFGGDCETTNDGDPIVLHDQFADRWLVSQFSYNGSGLHECVAVSTTADPLGSWNRYQFDYTAFPDYPKIGVWPDGYYVSYNMFDPVSFAYEGAKVCALDRASMLAGLPATQQCVDLAMEWSLLPSDADGSTPPPAGSPNYFLAEHWSDNDKLTMYKFHVDWDTPGLSTLEGPTYLPIDPFTWACLEVDRGKCVPQPGTSQRLEVLGGRMMHRLAYRNFGTHESLVANHSVAMDGELGQTSQTGVAWYEIRDPDAAQPQIHQQGTTADPDNATFRWMGSVAMDKQGNMALGYSSSNATSTYPSIEFVGRKIWDPLNQMPQAASTIIAGSGAQTHVSGRWGDYSSMNIDPSDDCTFWYTNEYIQTTGSANWQTRIASFRFPGCDGTVPTAPGAASAVPRKSSAQVSFTAATSDPDLPIWRYTVTASPGGATCTTEPGVTPDPLTCTVPGLVNGQSYTFSVTARNDAGDGPASGSSSPVTPQGVPDPPVSVAATAASTDSATVTWQAPSDDGGQPISGYRAVAAPGGNACTTSSTSCTITGLESGGTYTVTAYASNALGESSPSAASAAVTLSKATQTATVTTVKKIKSAGKTVLLKKAVTTNAGQKATAKVKVKPKGKKYATVKTTSQGKVTIKTTGRKKLKVTLTLSAPATAQYNAFTYSKKWTVKKS